MELWIAAVVAVPLVFIGIRLWMEREFLKRRYRELKAENARRKSGAH